MSTIVVVFPAQYLILNVRMAHRVNINIYGEKKNIKI